MKSMGASFKFGKLRIQCSLDESDKGGAQEDGETRLVPPGATSIEKLVEKQKHSHERSAVEDGGQTSRMFQRLVRRGQIPAESSIYIYYIYIYEVLCSATRM